MLPPPRYRPDGSWVVDKLSRPPPYLYAHLSLESKQIDLRELCVINSDLFLPLSLGNPPLPKCGCIDFLLCVNIFRDALLMLASTLHCVCIEEVEQSCLEQRVEVCFLFDLIEPGSSLQPGFQECVLTRQKPNKALGSR